MNLLSLFSPNKFQTKAYNIQKKLWEEFFVLELNLCKESVRKKVNNEISRDNNDWLIEQLSTKYKIIKLENI